MFRRNDSFASALLPLIPLAFCHGCGSASSDKAPIAEAPAVSAPAAVNQAPAMVARADESVRVGNSYDWQPVANDVDGDRLTFSASNLPPWASIDTNTGRIVGTPAEDDVGVYESITISVADNASHVTTSQPFSITVIGDAGNSGVASLRWESPLSKVDGSPLDDLAGYRILYGRKSSDLDKSVYIGDPAATSYEIGSLANGIWYFEVVAVSASGLEGPPTTIASKSI